VREQQARISRADEEDERIVAALRETGIEVSSVYDLVNRSTAAAIPVLLRFLPQNLEPKIKEGVVRALSIREARSVALRPMLEEFKQRNISDSLRWAIGNAIEVLATEEVLSELVELIQDKRYGRARQMVVLAVGKLKVARENAAALHALIRLLDEEEVRGHAIAALGKLRAGKARGKIKQFLAHPNAWIRREAQKALERIDKAAADRG
jgi:HEAT repeat protein